MKNKASAVVAAIIIVVVLAMIGGATWYVVSKKQSSSPPTTEDQFKDWKTYTNNRYSYSIKYPNNWFVMSDNSEKDFSKRGEDQLLIGGDTTWSNYNKWDYTPGNKPSDMKSISLMIFKNKNQSWLCKNSDAYDITENKQLTNDNGITYTRCAYKIKQGYELGGTSVVQIGILNSNDYLYFFATLFENRDVLDKMVSTFKFTK